MMKNKDRSGNKNLKWIIAITLFFLFLIIVVNIYKDNIAGFDDFFYKQISLLISDKMTSFVKIITNFGSAISLISITLLTMLLFKNKRYGILTMINLVVIFLFNLFLKFVFARPRPIDINIIEENGYSFPSAHSMVSTAFYGFVIYLITKSNIDKKQKLIYSLVLGLLIILICITRVYLGVHYMSDVLGGLLIAIPYLILFTTLIDKYLPNKKSSK